MTGQARVRILRRHVLAIARAVRDPRMPWYAKAMGACVVAYALSPIDLIPDFVPVLGYLDDLVLVPLGSCWCGSSSRLRFSQSIVRRRAQWRNGRSAVPGIRGDRRLDAGGAPARELGRQWFGSVGGPRVRYQLSGEIALS
jgi:uncharacterized membrane protein YkvA (DUF1232 family)